MVSDANILMDSHFWQEMTVSPYKLVAPISMFIILTVDQDMA